VEGRHKRLRHRRCEAGNRRRPVGRRDSKAAADSGAVARKTKRQTLPTCGR